MISRVVRIAVSALLFSVCPSSAQVPLNDTCDSAFVNSFNLAPGINAGFTNIGSTPSGIVPSACIGIPINQTTGAPFWPLNDVWFVYTPPGTCEVTFDASGSSPNVVVIAIYDGSGYSPGACAALPELGCDRFGRPVTVSLTAGNDYFVQVSSFFPNDTGAIVVDVAPSFGLSLTSPLGPGSLRVDNACGSANAPYVTVVTTAPGQFPNGWFFGIDIGVSDIFNQISLGAPFSGSLDATGSSTWSVPSGVPSGLMIYAVSIELNSGGIPIFATPATAYMTP